MPRLFSPRATWAVLRAGDLRTRLRALRESQGGLRMHMAAAALRTGLVDALADGPRTTADLAVRMNAADAEVHRAWLDAAASVGLIRARNDTWQLTRHGRAVRDDDLTRATYEAFADFHTGLYRELGPVLTGEQRRHDVRDKGGLIARVSAGFEPFVLGELTRLVTTTRTSRVLDVGCGAGVDLVTMVSAAPGVTGLGLDLDADAVALAERTIDEWGLGDRATVRHADVRDVVAEQPSQRFDVALLANVLYYLPPAQRVPLLRDVSTLLAPGGMLVVVTTVAEPTLFSRHFDLLLRSQEGELQLSDGDTLAGQLTDAGLTDVQVRRLVPGQPLVLASGVTPPPGAVAAR